jgi:hypothetical protein
MELLHRPLALFELLHSSSASCHAPGSVFVSCLAMMGLWFALIYVVDVAIARRFTGRYYALHAVINLLVCVPLSWGDMIKFFADPIRGSSAVGHCASKHPAIVTNTVHFYHLLFFSMKPVDLIHHVPAIIISLRSHWWPHD